MRIIGLTTLLGVCYTVFSEWLNVFVREGWAYTDWMPVLPLLGTGLTPVLQWLLLPGLALHLSQGTPARRPKMPSASSPSTTQHCH